MVVSVTLRESRESTFTCSWELLWYVFGEAEERVREYIGVEERYWRRYKQTVLIEEASSWQLGLYYEIK